jgi:transposase
MPAPLIVKLSLYEDKRLLEISQNNQSAKRTKQRAEALRLSNHGWKVEKIADYFNWHAQTVRELIQRWREYGEKGLYDQPKSGRPKQWQEEDLKYLEECLEKDKRVYNSQQLAEKLRQERNISLSSDRIRKLLKKRVGCGNVPVFRTRTSKMPNSKQANKQI